MTMAVRFGSARIDENGNASGGKAGDQTGREVAIEPWYLHRLGWVVIRAKTAAMREKIAKDMEWACANPYIGYDQGQNTTLWMAVKPLGFNCSKVEVYCETDCARLVRVCVWYAGSKPADFYTGSAVSALKATGDFEILTADKYCKSSDYLLRGDILCTRSKGHIVVCLDNGAKAGGSPSSGGACIKAFKAFLNRSYPSYVRKATDGALLAENGVWTKTTRNSALFVWKYMANKYYGGSLTIGNTNFFTSCKRIASRISVAECEKHPTLARILQGLLAGKGYYTGALDGVIGRATRDAIKKAQKGAASGNLTADTWGALFN